MRYSENFQGLFSCQTQVVGADRTAAHHQREFDFDEKGLETAFGIFKGCVLKLNGI